jgi:hypothetical protein
MSRLRIQIRIQLQCEFLRLLNPFRLLYQGLLKLFLHVIFGSTKGQFTSTRFFDEVFLTPLANVAKSDENSRQLAYLASLYTCYDTGPENITDPRMYAAKNRKDDPDMRTFHQAVNGPNADDYIEAMKLEVNTLVQQRTWEVIPRTSDVNVLKSTWVFKLKRLPDGTPLKFKARFCARGDLQKEGVDCFETYAPVVQWSTVTLDGLD